MHQMSPLDLAGIPNEKAQDLRNKPNEMQGMKPKCKERQRGHKSLGGKGKSSD